MQAQWTVLVEMTLHRQINDWSKRNRIELDALQRVLRVGGPAALDWDAKTLANCESWDEFNGSYRGDIVLTYDSDFVRVTLEVLSGQTVVIRSPD